MTTRSTKPTTTQPAGRSKATVKSAWLGLAVLTALIVAPTLMHGRPFVFFDTAQYYHYGAQLVGFAVAKGAGAASAVRPAPPADSGTAQAETEAGRTSGQSPQAAASEKSGAGGMAMYGARSPFYSAWLYAISQLFGLWGVVLLQCFAIAWIIWRAAVLAGAERPFEAASAMGALAILATGAWFTAGFIMPDVYAAIALSSLALLLAYSDRMGWGERLGFCALLAASALFHSTHFVTSAAIVIIGLAAAFLPFARKFRNFRGGLAAAAIALVFAFLLQVAFDAAARSLLGMSSQRPPFLMARIIADGPGRAYLNEVCPRDPRFVVCGARNHSFLTADEFLWSGVPGQGAFQTLSLDERIQLINEERRFVIAVFLHDPLALLHSAANNAFQQLILVSPSEAWFDPGDGFATPAFRDVSLFEVAPFLNSCIAQPGRCLLKLPEIVVASATGFMLALAMIVISLHVVLWGRPFGAASAGLRHERALLFCWVVILGILINAVLCGAVSGAHPRYNVRLIWLLVAGAVLLEIARPLLTTHLRQIAGRRVSS